MVLLHAPTPISASMLHCTLYTVDRNWELISLFANLFYLTNSILRTNKCGSFFTREALVVI